MQLRPVIASISELIGNGQLPPTISLLHNNNNILESPASEYASRYTYLLDGTFKWENVREVLTSSIFSNDVLKHGAQNIPNAPKGGGRQITRFSAHFNIRFPIEELCVEGECQNGLAKPWIILAKDLLAQYGSWQCPSGIKQAVSLRDVLVLVGAPGTGTGIHLDRTRAYNLAFRMAYLHSDKSCAKVFTDSVGYDQEAEGLPENFYALWLFILPTAAAFSLIMQYINTDSKFKKIKSKFTTAGYKGFGISRALQSERGSSVILSRKDLENIASNCGDACFITRQLDGQVMHVPIGFAHAVTNVRPCIKFALDVVAGVHDLPKIALANTFLASHHFGMCMAEDNVRPLDTLQADIDVLSARVAQGLQGSESGRHVL